jgi:hypothetical protein
VSWPAVATAKRSYFNELPGLSAAWSGLNLVTDDFPLELRQFIAQFVESLAQLEAMLLMHRDPQREWGCKEIARELYLSGDMCQGILADLEKRRLVVRSASGDRYRYASDPNVDRLVSQLGELYRQRRVAVITEIYSNPVKKVQTFADAFRLRPEE